jgi:hypothetical protein
MRDYLGALAFWLIMLAQFGAVISAPRRCQRGTTGIPGATRTGHHEGFLTGGSRCPGPDASLHIRSQPGT